MLFSFNRITGIAVFLFLMGCSTVPRGSNTLLLQSRTFTPRPGKASIYVVRPHNLFGACCLWNVGLDFQGFGNLGLGSYLYGFVDPGDHFVSVSNEGYAANRLRFTALPDRNYFFKISPGLNPAKIEIDALDEADGRSRVLEYTLSRDNRFELFGPQSSPQTELTDAEAYYNRGFAYGEKGQYDLAISDYTKALEINPRLGLAYENLGFAYFRKGQYDKAWEDVHSGQDLGVKAPPEFLNDLRKASGRQK